MHNSKSKNIFSYKFNIYYDCKFYLNREYLININTIITNFIIISKLFFIENFLPVKYSNLGIFYFYLCR